MATPIVMPKLGMTMKEGTIVDWPFSLGDFVNKGEPFLVIETEKAEVEIEATASGVFRHIYVEIGETVPCGTLLGALTDTEEEPFDVDAFHAAHNKPEPATAAPAPAPAASLAVPRAEAPVRGGPVTPAARGLAKKLGVSTDDIPGSGPGGRVTKEDVEAWVERRRDLREVAEGVSLEVPVLGEGDTVLLLPGFGTDVAAFARQTPLLAEHYRVVGVNPRGVGLSDAPEADVYGIATAAADAAAAAGGPAHIVGASMGAAVAVELALTHPQLVRSLTLITPCLEVSSRLAVVLDAWQRMAAECSSQTLARALLPWFFSPVFLADEKNRERSARGLAAIVARVPAQTVARTAAGLLDWSGSRNADLAGIEAPTLVLAAGDDLLTPGAEAVGESIASARTVSIRGAGHALALEAPDAVNEAILAHLRA